MGLNSVLQLESDNFLSCEDGEGGVTIISGVCNKGSAPRGVNGLLNGYEARVSSNVPSNK